jgi:uncharacterized protein (TIGR03437 family)
LISVFGSNLSPISATGDSSSVSSGLAGSCLTVNGTSIPMLNASTSQITAQLPFQLSGKAELILRTTGGTSDAIHMMILPAAPSVFLSGVAGPVTGIPTIFRSANGELVTPSNPIHPSDRITIYLTGMGQTAPEVPAGIAAPSAPFSFAVLQPAVTLGGVNLTVEFAGLTPGTIGVYQINAAVPPKGLPVGFEIPLAIGQGGMTNTTLVRVVN